jgi:SAM-dependent methyltransferase
MNCRHCNHTLNHVFIDLGNSPPSNAYLTKAELNEAEHYFPLKIFVCEKCFLVQVDEYKKATEIFDGDYAYFSSVSKSWLAHSQKYTEKMIAEYGINEASQVIEIASNDGYLLQYFKENGVSVLGIEPTASTANVAREKGIESLEVFFGEQSALDLKSKGRSGDLILGNNVLAHVPDINDFVKGLSIALKPDGIVTMEFPHLYELVRNNQFDTIYHEHFSYLSFTTVRTIFNQQGLELFHVEQLPTHGGSLRIFAKHKQSSKYAVQKSVQDLLDLESNAGITKMAYYADFDRKVARVKIDFMSFLLDANKQNKRVAAYGAAAKGNTMLNYFGIKNDYIEFVVDLAPSKQNKYLPGSHIPVVDEQYLKNEKPDYIIIFPWNIKEEIYKQLDYTKAWGAKFVTAIPHLEII